MIFNLVREYRPLLFFGVIGLVLMIIAACFFGSVVAEFFQTHLVPRIPTLVVSVVLLVLGLLLISTGLILDGTAHKARKTFEIDLNELMWRRRLENAERTPARTRARGTHEPPKGGHMLGIGPPLYVAAPTFGANGERKDRSDGRDGCPHGRRAAADTGANAGVDAAQQARAAAGTDIAGPRRGRTPPRRPRWLGWQVLIPVVLGVLFALGDQIGSNSGTLDLTDRAFYLRLLVCIALFVALFEGAYHVLVRQERAGSNDARQPQEPRPGSPGARL